MHIYTERSNRKNRRGGQNARNPWGPSSIYLCGTFPYTHVHAYVQVFIWEEAASAMIELRCEVSIPEDDLRKNRLPGYPGTGFKYEIWNDSTFLRTVVYDDLCGRWVLSGAPERALRAEGNEQGSLVHWDAKGKRADEAGQTVFRMAFVVENPNTDEPRGASGSVWMEMYFPRHTDILFRVRSYRKLPLTRPSVESLRPGARGADELRWKWTRIGDASVSEGELRAAEQPLVKFLYIPCDEYTVRAAQNAEAGGSGKVFRWFETYDHYTGTRCLAQGADIDSDGDVLVKVERMCVSRTGGGGGRVCSRGRVRAKELAAWIRTVFAQIVAVEMYTMSSLKDAWSALVRRNSRYFIQSCAALQFRVPGRELEATRSPVTFDLLGTASHSIWYVYNARRRAVSGSERTRGWYLEQRRPVVEEGWLRARLAEVLEVQGRTEAEFLDWTRTLVALCATGAGGEAWRTRAVRRARGAFRVAARVLCMHCETRNYMEDRNTFFATSWMHTDSATCALSGPGDCEDAAMAVYQIACSVLVNRKWQSCGVRALRQVVAMLGVPCGLVGAAGDVLGAAAAPADARASPGGHALACLIPFRVFVRSVQGGEVADAAQARAFEAFFGFPAPEFHTKPCVLDAVLHSTPFYSDHREVSARKAEAAEGLRGWLARERGEPADVPWSRYTVAYSTGRDRASLSYAYRLSTEAHLCIPGLRLRYRAIEPPKEVRDGTLARFVSNTDRYYTFRDVPVPSRPREPPTVRTEEGVCRSFVFYQPHAYETPEEYYRLFPAARGALETRTERARFERLRESQGYGLPVELLGHGRQRLLPRTHREGTADSPQGLFELHAVVVAGEGAVDMDRFVYEAYTRPAVPLRAGAVDVFAERSRWMEPFLLVDDARNPVPPESNERLVMYMYDVDGGGRALDTWRGEMDALARVMGARYWRVRPYAWSLAVIFAL